MLNKDQARLWWERFSLDDGENKKLFAFGFKQPIKKKDD